MTASLETLVIAAYVFATSLPIPRPGPAGETTDAELIALSVAQAAMGISSDRQFLGLVPKVLPGGFGPLPPPVPLQPPTAATDTADDDRAVDGRRASVRRTGAPCRRHP
jgi:hypothetical protein